MNFIIIIEGIENPQLLIALKWFHEVTDFQPVANTAFINHPKRPPEYENFAGYADAYNAKKHWEKFLENYLNK